MVNRSDKVRDFGLVPKVEKRTCAMEEAFDGFGRYISWRQCSNSDEVRVDTEGLYDMAYLVHPTSDR
jgi:hypothetical protein